MKILVISDTHHSINRVDMLLDMYIKEGVRHLIHCGDHIDDAQEIATKYPELEVYMVPGNCDMAGYGPNISKLIEIGQVPIFITHGHRHHVKYEYDEIAIDVIAHDAKLGIFGHTHIAYKGEKDGILLLNPGSISEPRDTTMPSFAIVEIQDKSIINIELLHLVGKNRVIKHSND